MHCLDGFRRVCVILVHSPQKTAHCTHHNAWIESHTDAAPNPPYATPTSCPESTYQTLRVRPANKT